MTETRPVPDDEVMSQAEAAKFLKRSLTWLKRSNVPVAILPGRTGSDVRGHRVYLKSELLAYVRAHLTHSVRDTVEPRPRRAGGLRRTG